MYLNYKDFTMTEDDVVYTKELVESMPTSSLIQEQIQSLREELERVELEKEEMLVLLHEIADAEGIEELDEVIVRVKSFIEDKTYPTPY